MRKFKVKLIVNINIEALDAQDARIRALRYHKNATIQSVEEIAQKYKAGDIFINPANGILFKIGFNTEQGLLLFKVTQGINVVGVLGHKERVTLEELLKAWGGSPHNTLVPCPWETYWQTQVVPLLCKHGLNTRLRSPIDTLAMFSQYGLPDLAESVGVYL